MKRIEMEKAFDDWKQMEEEEEETVEQQQEDEDLKEKTTSEKKNEKDVEMATDEDDEEEENDGDETEKDGDGEDEDDEDDEDDEEAEDQPEVVKVVPGNKDTEQPEKMTTEAGDHDKDNDDDLNKKPAAKPTSQAKEKSFKPVEGLIKRYYARLPDKNIKQKFVRRYDLKVWAKPSTEGNLVLAEQFRKWFKKVKDFDKSAMLVTYRKEDKFWYCLNAESIPESVSKMKELFQGANPRPKGGGIYVQCLLAHNKPFKEIMKEISWSFNDDKMGMWERHCQAEQTVEVGWFLYSLRDMDIGDLRAEFEQWFGASIGLRWRAIKVTTGSTWNPNRTEADTPKALHIVLNKQDVSKVKPLLKKIYSHGSTNFPLGVKMRYIPVFANLIGAHARGKMQQVAARQASFCAHMKGATSWEILSLDNEDKEKGLTLREVIMSLKSKQIPSLSVFHCIAPSWKADGSIRFYFIPQLADEAQMMIAGLLPILRYFYGDWVEKSFTVSAIERTSDCTWDPVLQQVNSPNDDIMPVSYTHLTLPTILLV